MPSLEEVQNHHIYNSFVATLVRNNTLHGKQIDNHKINVETQNTINLLRSLGIGDWRIAVIGAIAHTDVQYTLGEVEESLGGGDHDPEI